MKLNLLTTKRQFILIFNKNKWKKIKNY